MNNTVKEDIAFLLNFVPAISVDKVEEGLLPVFYITGSYDGDIELIQRVEKIIKTYDIDINTIEEEEDFAED